MRTLRLRRLAAVFLVVIAVLVARLFQLQILEHDQWTETARNSRTGKYSIPFQRGRILDRNGVILAVDRQAYDLFFRYRDFRRGFIAAQLFEALRLVGYKTDGLVDCLKRGEELGALCLALRPQDFASLPSGARQDLRFYLTGMTGNRSFSRRVAIQDWESEGQQAFAVAFPGATEYLSQQVREARHNVQFLENLLQSKNPLPLLERLEQRRRELEVMVARAALQEAASRVFDFSASTMRSQLESPLPERREYLQDLHGFWQLEGTLAHFGVVLAPLPQSNRQLDRSEQQAFEDFQKLSALQQAAVIRAVLEHLKEVAPDDVKGVLRNQTKRIHELRVLPLERDLDFEMVDLLSQQAGDYPGLYLQEVTQRLYPVEVARMVVGSLHLPSSSDLKGNDDRRELFDMLRRLLHRNAAEEAEFRRLRDWLWSDSLAADERKGQDGVELVYEPVLRGSRGYLQELEGGAEGALPLELLFSPPQNGSDIKLALDAGMIQAAEESIRKVYAETIDRINEQKPLNITKALRQFDPKQQKVGFVIMNVHSGEVPVLVSTPQVARKELRSNYDQYKDLRSGTPLRNRAFGGGFSGMEQPYPGSTFKPLVAAAALAVDARTWNRRYICEGFYTPKGTATPIKCDSKYGHHEIDMREALKKSCNIYFYQLGDDIGAAALHQLATELGFAAKKGQARDSHVGTGNELSQGTRLELNANYLIDLSRMESDIKTRMRTSIGQVGVLASPLQMARLFGWLATGELVRPRLVLEGGGASPARESLPQPVLSAQTRARIAEALSAVVYEEGGTAFRTAFPADWQIVAKTGTAEIGGSIPTHAWFTGYFPADDPQYAFAVLCENTGLHGGQIASYILKEFLLSPEGSELLQ